MLTRPVVVDKYIGLKILAPSAVEQLHAIADSTAAQTYQWAVNAPQYERDAGYAQGVADALAWLNGAKPSTALTELLDG